MPYQPQPAKVNISTVSLSLLFTTLSLQEGVDKLAYYQGQLQELTKLLNVCMCGCVCACVHAYVCVMCSVCVCVCVFVLHVCVRVYTMFV